MPLLRASGRQDEARAPVDAHELTRASGLDELSEALERRLDVSRIDQAGAVSGLPLGTSMKTSARVGPSGLAEPFVV